MTEAQFVSELIRDGFAIRDRAHAELRAEVATVKAAVQRVEADMTDFHKVIQNVDRVTRRFDEIDDKLQTIERAARFVCAKKTWGFVIGALVFVQWIGDRLSHFPWF